MRVAFDGVCFADTPVTGVGRAFASALAAYVAAAPSGSAVLLLPEGASDPAVPGLEVVRAPAGALRRQLQIPPLLRRLDATVLHSSVASIPLRSPCPAIATVHDLPWLHPESGERTEWRRRAATVRALRAATAIVVPSRFTLASLRALLGDEGTGKATVIPHGTPLPAGPLPDPAARSGPFLVLGDDRPRKNRDRVRAAHAEAKARRETLPELRFVGPPGDYVLEKEKDELLRTCRAVVQCSRFEGFGLPVLEALAHGAPLVCSDLPPHREIAEDAALFVEPFDVSAIATALERIDADIALRAKLAREGPRRAAAFAPARTAAAWRILHAAVAGEVAVG